MKKNSFALLFFALLTATFFASCSDDTTTNPDDSLGYGFPLTAGSWWKFSSYDVGPEGEKVEGSDSEYSITLGEQKMIDGKNATKLISDDQEEDANSFVFSDNSGFYNYFPPSDDEEENFFTAQLPSGWVKTLDYKNTNWIIFEKDYDFTQELGEEFPTINYTGKVEMTGTNVGKENFVIKGKTYEAIRFLNISKNEGISTTEFEGEVEVSEYSGIDTTNYLFVHGIGLVKVTYGTSNQLFNSSVDSLVQFEIKK